MADVISELSEDGHVRAMMRLDRQPDGSLMVEINDGGPNTAQMRLTPEKAALLAEIGFRFATEWSPALAPDRVNGRIAAAMQSGF
ncbi:hypothetical protein FF100_04690 [Methylobacterium terricola]|uniref:Uncharacterized protein n=1 Tax=Methylobacterium terricola TaxID=2583531 RepID=A0A5C4LN62_9HYPH|nr:hypothetical protein [Methylobacterium terricola]TNC14879.1 hypothetical protein FF100_04690 [Methylobacterium terricola]